MVYIPSYKNISVVSFVGFIMDVIIGGPWRSIRYICFNTHSDYISLKTCFSFNKIVMLKQMIIIFIISLLMNISNYILLLIIHHNFTFLFLYRSIMNALFWPLLFLCMEKIHYSFLLKY